MPLRGKILEQAPNAKQVDSARGIGQRWFFLSQAANPGEQMRIAAQLGKVAHLRKIDVEIGKEAMSGGAIISSASVESRKVSVKDVLDFLVGQSRR